MYVLAELLGGALAAGAAIVLYGLGPDWARFHDHSAKKPSNPRDEEVTYHNEVGVFILFTLQPSVWEDFYPTLKPSQHC